MQVLSVEDNPRTAQLLARGLREAGHDVTATGRGEDAIRLSSDAAFDAIILDVALPGIDGYETCRRLRSTGDRTPVLMLTARGALVDRVGGLDAGADDYLTKPYQIEEVLARLRALRRRSGQDTSHQLRVGDLAVDVEGAVAWRGGRQVALTACEARVLGTLMREAGRVVTRPTIAELAWGGTLDLRSNVIDVHIRSLRRKLDEPFGVQSIETVRGTGYRLRLDAGG